MVAEVPPKQTGRRCGRDDDDVDVDIDDAGEIEDLEPGVALDDDDDDIVAIDEEEEEDDAEVDEIPIPTPSPAAVAREVGARTTRRRKKRSRTTRTSKPASMMLFKERLVVEDEPSDAEATDQEQTSPSGNEHVLPKQPDEFVCRSCFLVKHPSQLADKKKMLCRDCV